MLLSPRIDISYGSPRKSAVHTNGTEKTYLDTLSPHSRQVLGNVMKALPSSGKENASVFKQPVKPQKLSPEQISSLLKEKREIMSRIGTKSAKKSPIFDSEQLRPLPREKLEMENKILRRKIRAQRHLMGAVTQKYELLEKEHKKLLENSTVKETELRTNIRKLTERVEELVEKESDMKGRLGTKQVEVVDLKNKVESLESHEAQMKQLIMEQLQLSLDEVPNSQVELAIQRLSRLEKITAPKLIQESTPPISYPEYIPNKNVGDSTVQAVRRELESAREEIKRLQQKIEENEKSVTQQRRRKVVREKERGKVLGIQQRQLFGAVRRINWLLEERKKLNEEVQKHKEYAKKLERRLLIQTRGITKTRMQKAQRKVHEVDDGVSELSANDSFTEELRQAFARVDSLSNDD